MAGRGVFSRILGVLCATMLFSLVVGVATVSAHRAYTNTGSFGVSGTGAGGLEGPQDLAVSEPSSDVFVADTKNARVEVFTSTGSFVLMFGGDVNSATHGDTCTAAESANCQVGSKGALGGGEFEEPTYVAVDNSCAEQGLSGTECEKSDPSNGDAYVADTGTDSVYKFDATGHYISANMGSAASHGPFSTPVGITVDKSGDLWVYEQHYGMFEFGQDGTLIQEWMGVGAWSPAALAIDNAGGVYLVSGYDNVEKLKTNGEKIGQVTLVPPRLGGFNGAGEPPTGLAVEPADGTLFVDFGGSIARIPAPCEPSPTEVQEHCAVAESFGVPGLSGGAGLAVDSGSGVVYAAEPGLGRVVVFTPEVPEAPSVEGESESFVTSGSATFSAVVNPRGPETEYFFEYGITRSYGERAPLTVGVVGSGFGEQEVSASVQDLAAGTTYHFRVVTSNSKGTTYGGDQTFITQVVGGASGLPDGRSWELVSPPDKHGALIYGYEYGGRGPLQSSAAGDAISYLASQPTESGPQGYSNEVSVLSTRGGEGWSSQVIAPKVEGGATGVDVGGLGQDYRFFSEDLSRAVVQPFGNFTALSPEAVESTPYVRSDYLNGNVSEHCGTSCYQPLVTRANTREGAVFGEEQDGKCGPRFVLCGPQFVDATPDLSHVIVDSPVQLTSVAPITTVGEPALYEWSAGQLQLVSILPPGEEGSASLAGNRLNSRSTVEEPGARHSISTNGERVLLQGRGHLYLRNVVQGETIRLDVPQGGPAGAESKGLFYMTASSDDSRVFFLDSGHLTSESSAGGEDLYEYNLNAPAGSRLTDLSVDKNSEEPAEVKEVLGASEDGSYVYFAAAGVLASGASHSNCGAPNRELETCNVYVRHDGVTQLVGPAGPEEGMARVSADGQWLAFMSDRDLTGYDTRDAVSGHLDQEVYLYNANTAKLVCASCNPTGARPVGLPPHEPGLVGGGDTNSRWMASNVPSWTRFATGYAGLYQPRYLSDSGRLFFDSNDALVPQDVNGTEDAYEYEPAGVGDCVASSLTFSERSGGCVGLISSGSSPEESAFLDASETGGDVFFLTLAKLVSQDYDTALDVYDAHECTGVAPCYPASPAVSPVCSTGDACKAAPTPQPSIFGGAPSATFSGAGNVQPEVSTPQVIKPRSLTRAQKLARALKACHKKRHERAVCERKTRRQYASKGSRKVSVVRGKRG